MAKATHTRNTSQSGPATARIKAARLAATAPRDMHDRLPTDPWSRLALSLAADLGARPAPVKRAQNTALLAELRPHLKARGVLWGVATIKRYHVTAFSDMTSRQMRSLRAELLASRPALG